MLIAFWDGYEFWLRQIFFVILFKKQICHFYSFSVKERCRQHRTNHVQRIARLVSAVDGVLSSASVPRPDHPSVHQWARGAPRCAQYTGTYIVNFKICLQFASKIIIRWKQNSTIRWQHRNLYFCLKCSLPPFDPLLCLMHWSKFTETVRSDKERMTNYLNSIY